jgi:hypothetical protein
MKYSMITKLRKLLLMILLGLSTAAQTGEKTNTKLSLENLLESKHLEDHDRDRRK